MSTTTSPAPDSTLLDAAPTEPALSIATMNDWWALTRRYPEFRLESHSLLKDFGYMQLMGYFDALAPERALEMGHGFNATFLRHAQKRCELHAIDNDQGLVYFPSGEQWNDLYAEHIAAPCREAKLHRGLLGVDGGHDLEPDSFDMIASVSVLEELDTATLNAVVADAARLLRQGGALVGSFDLILNRPRMLEKLVAACDAAGLDIPRAPGPISAAKWNDVLIESPSVVMLTYQMGQREHRTYSGHWGAAWFVAIKR
ncbi:MAG: hypothetical protein CMJ31_12345 [Phycisphaerae bacterium]|nr:hypothetical protein [Phycisphaerae bacterium]